MCVCVCMCVLVRVGGFARYVSYLRRQLQANNSHAAKNRTLLDPSCGFFVMQPLGLLEMKLASQSMSSNTFDNQFLHSQFRKKIFYPLF